MKQPPGARPNGHATRGQGWKEGAEAERERRSSLLPHLMDQFHALLLLADTARLGLNEIFHLLDAPCLRPSAKQLLHLQPLLHRCDAIFLRRYNMLLDLKELFKLLHALFRIRGHWGSLQRELRLLNCEPLRQSGNPSHTKLVAGPL